MEKLKSPLEKFNPGQRFGENGIPYYKQSGMLGHNGIDFPCPIGTPILATHDGIVLGTYQDSSGGLGIEIRTDTFKTVYWHIKEGGFKVHTGQEVKCGDVIALSGNTGVSSGPHLHFGLKEIEYNSKTGIWDTKNKENGYRGGIDPMPYFDMPQYEKMRTIRKMADCEDVKILQALLVAHGCKIIIDGKFGNNTESCVKAFQKRNELLEDGIVGRNTWAKLYKF